VGETPTILVTGGSGQLGGELVRRSRAAGWQAVGTWLTHEMDGLQLDICDAQAVDSALAQVRPDVVVHTAYRFTGPEMHAVNVAGTANVARAAGRAGARLIHVSTDVVFDGESDRPYRESDEPRPITDYGRAKLAAEREVAARDPVALIVRTSLLYGGARPGPHEQFVLDALDGRRDVGFFTDEVRCPVHVGDLADALLQLARSSESGVVHAAGAEAASRFEFAQLVAAAHGHDPARVRAAESAAQDVTRPLNCALDSGLLAARYGRRLRGVREVLAGPDLH
jgi:dTDP-4-dehydrorhamnose reductase